MKKILLAGATGYLGSHIAKKLNQSACDLRMIARSPNKLAQLGIEVGDVFQGKLTRPETIKGCCSEIDTVVFNCRHYTPKRWSDLLRCRLPGQSQFVK